MVSSVEPPHSGPGRLAVVLSGGGARASYQVGALAAITERVPELNVPILTGVSAGAINAVSLAAHRGTFSAAVATLRREWKRLTSDQVYCVNPVSVVQSALRWVLKTLTGGGSAPGVMRGLMDMSPLRAFLGKSVVLDGIASNIASKRLDGVALSATCYSDGRTVTFIQGSEEIPMWERALRRSMRTDIQLDHVIASAAIPIVFPAVKLEDGFYGDGSVRQTAPLAPAVHLGADRIIAISMRAARQSYAPSVPIGDYPAVAEVMSLLLNSVFLDHLDVDVERLERVNELIASLNPGQAAPHGFREVDMLLLRPSRDLGLLAEGHGSRLPWMVRMVVQGIGGRRRRASDLLSYLMFEPEYTEALMELGYSDVGQQWPRIEEFLAGGD
jgi:NTE family protein